MAIAEVEDLLQTQIFKQGDVRDPLGVWGFRHGVTGDASGGSIKVTAEVPSNRAGAYVYTVYGLFVAKLAGAGVASIGIKSRILTNWPNIDPDPGIVAYGHINIVLQQGNTLFTAPIAAPTVDLVGPNSRFMLIYRPFASDVVMSVFELEIAENVDTATYSFEGYGYYWDRAVMDAPGGPRHPGSS